MNHASLDNADPEKSAGEIDSSSNPPVSGSSAAAVGDHSTREIVELKAECARLSALVHSLEKERDAYQKSLTYYLAQHITREDVEASATTEEGVPFEVILQDMAQIEKDCEFSPKP
jgi:hypothetical protein